MQPQIVKKRDCQPIEIIQTDLQLYYIAILYTNDK